MSGLKTHYQTRIMPSPNEILYGQAEQLKLIKASIPELFIELNDGAYDWTYRCMESGEYPDGDRGFSSSLDALIHFTKTILDLDDQAIDTR